MIPRIRLFLLILSIAAAGRSESFAVGVRGGVPLTNDFLTGGSHFRLFDGEFSSKTRRYAAGPAVTAPLPFGLGLEIDLLYRRLAYDSFGVSLISGGDAGTIYSWQTVTGNRFDLPILVRCPLSRVHRRAGRFYVLGGPQLGIHYGFTERSHTISNLQLAGNSEWYGTYHGASRIARDVATAVTAGMGFDARAGRVHIKPEVRYSRWVSPAFENNPYIRTEANQVLLFLGFDFDIAQTRR